MNDALAHRDAKTGATEPLHEHIRLVARRAGEHASEFGAAQEALLCGLLHDIGKYGNLFQQRIRGEATGVDHWSLGAQIALQKYGTKGVAAALAVQGHHVGVQTGELRSLSSLSTERLVAKHPLGLRLSEPDASKLLAAFQADSLTLSPNDSLPTSLYAPGAQTAAAMLDVRMLFSALVDADFVETEAWFERNKITGARCYRVPGPPLEPEKALLGLELHLEELARKSEAAAPVRKMRADLLKACLAAANLPVGLFTLTAPTGSGKTLSMLSFALAHAVAHRLRRIIMVVPYLTIIEQTARAYRKAFNSGGMNEYVLEHHSLSGGDRKDRGRLLTENWDAPIIITTSVQFLESLFSNRPSACRKLHRLAKSVILFDEVQSLPTSLAIPTLATLSHLANRYGSSVVLSTATQPAFGHLNEHVRKHCACGWEPREIVAQHANLFACSRRVLVNWQEAQKTAAWSDIADRIAAHKRVLCIVNVKAHAAKLFNMLKARGVGEVFHLSTSMCPAHRKTVLDRVRSILDEDKSKSCYLVSTQCVEAGVDIDFPVVYRAMAPLDAIAQAAGRCNRNGLAASGTLHVFLPVREGAGRIYPDGAYEQAASITEIMLSQHGPDGLDANDPDVYQQYYRMLYNTTHPEDHKEDLTNAILLQNFAGVARLYRLIPRNTINVLVPYDSSPYRPHVYDWLRADVLRNGLTRRWIRKARPYTVSLYRPGDRSDPLYDALEPVSVERGATEKSEEWYVYSTREDYGMDYSMDTGLTPSRSPQAIIG